MPRPTTWLRRGAVLVAGIVAVVADDLDLASCARVRTIDQIDERC